MNAKRTMPVGSIHQIEMTSRCNLRCQYCVHRSMAREKLDMSPETYAQALHVTRRLLAQQSTKQRELNLAGIGESTMHPDFVRNVYLAREAVGDDVALIIATNGLLVDDALAQALKDAKPLVYVSLHRPERANRAIEALKSAGILAGVSADGAVASVDWAGQIKWPVSTPVKGAVCPWMQSGKVIVLSDGRIARCSFDGTGDETIGTVWDDIATLRTGPYRLCAACHMVAEVS